MPAARRAEFRVLIAGSAGVPKSLSAAPTRPEPGHVVPNLSLNICLTVGCVMVQLELGQALDY